jgi:hypothetical protein
VLPLKFTKASVAALRLPAGKSDHLNGMMQRRDSASGCATVERSGTRNYAFMGAPGAWPWEMLPESI